MGYSYIDWNALNKDSERKYTNKQLLENLKQSIKNKNILVILMHDTKDVNDSSCILNESINYLKNQSRTSPHTLIYEKWFFYITFTKKVDFYVNIMYN